MKSLYKKCLSCGKYFLDSAEKSKYCSDQCKELFVRCTICGNYFQINDKEIDIENYICSKNCAKKFIIKDNKKNQKLDFSKL